MKYVLKCFQLRPPHLLKPALEAGIYMIQVPVLKGAVKGRDFSLRDAFSGCRGAQAGSKDSGAECPANPA
ncbi:unnamed protein product [Larinioides sclopetarius]|uniref:Uncharacterized protein n=1 Tax=Larinioides sclopetarius TaxID=280406 RepID=A0AAV1YP82_9ARAC